MYKPTFCVVAVLAVAFCLPDRAEAQPILLQRCNADSLDVNQAARRVEWARHCGLTKNIRNPASAFVSGEIGASGQGLFDYLEGDPNLGPLPGLYTGDVLGYEMNATNVYTLFLSGLTSQSREIDGYWRWSRTRKRVRPLYPTFGTTADLSDPANKQLYANNEADPSDCSLYTGAPGTGAATTPTFFVNGYCESSCYTPDQMILFEGGEVSILDALRARRADLMTLAPSATLERPALMVGQTDAYTVETRDTTQKVLVINTQSGGRLAVTEEHPIINGEGRMVQAKTLKVGDELVRANGQMDPITQIESTMHFGKVYNVRPVSETLIENVLVAQGFLVGSSRFQNDDVGFINRTIIYRTVPVSMIP